MWKELAFVAAMEVMGILGAAYLFAGGLGGGLLAVTVVGLPLLALLVLGGRLFGAGVRRLCASLLDSPIAQPRPTRRRPGAIGFVQTGLTDLAGWRALLFLLAEAAVGMVGGYVVLVFAVMVLFSVISPLPWWLAHPENVDADGVAHHSLVQFGDYYFDTWPRVLAWSAVGLLVMMAVLPWVLHGVCQVHLWLARTLLGPSARDQRESELEAGRTAAVEDSAATLRRLERDLHDGTQARLVTVAMALGQAEERLAHGSDADDLIAGARANTKEALVELRELVRGIHPPALDAGLAPALETLASRSRVPVQLDIDLSGRPAPGVETIAYFTVAELLTNIAKHAGPTEARVTVRGHHSELVITVSDDGRGGADPTAGSGLAGLAARVGTVDGTMHIDSPHGGPTTVTVTLPQSGRRPLRP